VQKKYTFQKRKRQILFSKRKNTPLLYLGQGHGFGELIYFFFWESKYLPLKINFIFFSKKQKKINDYDFEAIYLEINI